MEGLAPCAEEACEAAISALDEPPVLRRNDVFDCAYTA
jgi:hypothetical protein